MPALYAQTSGNLSTNASSFTAIPGLKLTLPEGVNVTAIVTLNLPNPYAKGNDYPGAIVGITIGGNLSPVQGCFTYGIQNPPSTNRMPTTLVVGVPLTGASQIVQAVWQGVRGSTVVVDTPVTFNAVF